MIGDRRRHRTGVLQWVIVLVVGVAVVGVVLALNLIPRLSDGQKVLDAARPAFDAQRVAGDRAGVNMISQIVDLSDPIVTPQGGGAGEVPALLGYVARTQHVSPAQALVILKRRFPHTAALLQAIPLTAVTRELPGLVAFLAKALKLTPAQVNAALKANFPALAQAIANLPAVTEGWLSVPGIGGLTRFDKAPVRSVPDLRTYFSADVIPVLERQGGNFGSLAGTSAVDWIAPLLLIVGIVVILFAAVMALRSGKGVTSRAALASATVVPVVGVVIVALVLVLSLIPRVSNGQTLLDSLRPAYAQDRMAGDRVGINMVSTIVDTLDPITTTAGGAAAEVPKLASFVSHKTRLSPTAVLAALGKGFPHTTALLQALPLTAVDAEIPSLVGFLGPPVVAVIPHLLPTVLSAQAVTTGWKNVPGIGGLTRFDGTPVKTVPQLRTYFSSDLIPVLETQRGNYDSVVSTSNIDFLGWLVLAVGVIVIIYGLIMVFLAQRLKPGTA
ncbi:MAG: hypothetical protein ACR2OB_04895 [Solirubrobacteraceae bacterium]